MVNDLTDESLHQSAHACLFDCHCHCQSLVKHPIVKVTIIVGQITGT